MTGARRAAGLLALLVGLGVLGVAAPAGWAWLNSRGRVLTATQAPARDVAIIFGAEVYASGRPSPYLRARLALGARLYREGKARALVVSGDGSAAPHPESAARKRYLVAAGVPAGRGVEDPYGLDTYDTCVRAREVYGVTEALLVSQRYHLTRAGATCRAVGVDAVGVGDVSVRRTSRRWNEFVRREYLAGVKMGVALVTRRAPVLGPRSDAVRDALA